MEKTIMNYEDELDRMRAQKKRSGTASRRKPANIHEQRENSRADRTYRSEGVGRNPRAEYRPPENEARQRAGIERLKRRKRKRRNIIIGIAALILLLTASFLLFKQRTHQEGYWTIAIFGVDSRDGNLEKGALSDVEMICNIDKATGEIKLVSVFRDTYLKINSEGTYHKINEAYAKGGHKQAVEALNENLDLKIDDYATFNWKSVAQAINILDGIDIEITDAEFAYINSFITETVNSTGIGSHQLKKAGMNHLDGVQAVSYARLRLMDTDFNRTERQRKVVSLALEKAKQADFNTLKSLISAILPQISTSVGIEDLIPVAKGIKDYHLGESAGFPFSRTTMKIGKMDCVIATTLESNVIQLHQFLFNQTDYSPSSAVKKISSKISEVSGIGEPGKNAPSGGNSKKKDNKATEAPKQETSAPETTTVEVTSAAVSVEETTIQETTETEKAEQATETSENLIGPGATIKESEMESKTEIETSEVGPGV